MAEAIGAIAAATQLASNCLTLFEMLQRSLRTESIIQSCLIQVKDLHSISESIQLNPSLQTLQVEGCTKAIIKAITESTIITTLKKKRPRVLKACTVVFKQKELTEFLRSLENKKTILILCIANKQSLVLHEICADIGRVFNRSSDGNRMPSQSKTKAVSMPLPLSYESQQEVHTEKVGQTRKAGDKALFEGQKHYGGSGRQVLGAVVKNPIKGIALEEMMANHVYKDNIMSEKDDGKEEADTVLDQHSDGARREQVCGVVFEEKATPERFAGEWKNNVFEGDGDQVMGLII